MVGSVTGAAPPVEGWPCSHYTNSSNWNFTCTNGGTLPKTLNYANCIDTNPPQGTTKCKFWDVFGIPDPGSNAVAGKSCATILQNYSTSDEAIFLCALFNANKLSSTFSYKPAEVCKLYRSLNPKQNDAYQADIKGKARTLFESYLSSKVV
jgi:hypothetical protein